MTNQQREIIEQSWQYLVDNESDPGMIFYNRLFEIAPSLRPLFKSDMKAQSHKVIESIAHVVQHLNDSEMVIYLRSLGAGHNKFKVKPVHYDFIEAAFLWTLQKVLGAKWNDDVKQAWTELYTIIATEMKDAAEAAR